MKLRNLYLIVQKFNTTLANRGIGMEATMGYTLAWVNSFTKINIKDTNDYFEITDKVKIEIKVTK